MARLEAYAWPGNVRELRNLMERLVLMTRGPRIVEADLPESVRAGARSEPGDPATLDEARKSFEREYLMARLEEHGWHISRTAEAVGMARESLSRKIRQLGIEVQRD
jgi:two-component system nitrogen regulation response regulator NtrX